MRKIGRLARLPARYAGQHLQHIVQLEQRTDANSSFGPHFRHTIDISPHAAQDTGVLPAYSVGSSHLDFWNQRD